MSEHIGMTIGALAKAGGVGVETVRYYQRIGLLPTPARSGATRRYGPDDLRRLRFVRSAQRAGFTLDEAGELLSLDASDDRSRAQALAKARLASLDARITELQRTRESLARLAGACASGEGAACPILAAFDGD